MDNNQRTMRTRQLVRVSLFTALIILQTWVPFLGNINIPPISITFIHMTVIIAALWLGPKVGLLIGTVWGINSLIRAFVAPASPVTLLIFTSPFISILPRALMGWLMGLLGQVIKSRKSTVLMIFGVVGALLNTGLVLSAIYLFKGTDYAQAMGVEMNSLWGLLGGLVLANGLPEAIFSGLVTPVIYRTLSRQQ